MKSEKFLLNAQSIDTVSEKIQAYLFETGMERSNITMLRLSIEDILLKWKDKFGENTPLSFELKTRFGRPIISLEIAGEEFNPLTDSGEDSFIEEFSLRLLANLGLSPVFSYKNGINTVSLNLKKKRKNPIYYLVISAIAATVIGFVGLQFSAQLREDVLNTLIDPIYNAFLRILATIAGPLIFTSVACGIYGIGDITTFGRVGKRMLIRFFIIMIVATGFASTILLPAFNVTFGNVESASGGASGLLSLVLNIIPQNMISPFTEGNSMQIICMATLLGIVLLIRKNETRNFARVLEEANVSIQTIMEIISGLIAAFVFFVLVKFIWSDSIHTVFNSWKLIFFTIVCYVILLVAELAYISQRKKVAFMKLVKKLSPAFIIGLTTASSQAAYGTMTNTCTKDIGIKAPISNFGIPLSMTLFMPATGIWLAACTYYFAGIYGIEISLSWIVSAVLISTIAAMAMPPIVGGALACYSILFSQMGIPAEAIGIVVVLDVINDFFSTGSDMLLCECELLLQADAQGMLDREILRG